MKTSMARGGTAIGLATALASACNYATNMALGRWLGATAFGDAALMVSSLLLLSAVATGIQLSVARTLVVGGSDAEVSRLRGRARRGGLLVGGGLSLSAPLLAEIFHTASVVPFVFLGLGVPVYFELAVRRGSLQAQGAFGRLAGTLAAEALARVVCTIGCLAIGMGAAAASAGLLGSFIAACLIGVPIDPPGTQSSAPEMGGRSAPSSSMAMLMLLSAQVLIANGDLLVVTARLPKEAGIYAAVALIGRVVYVAAWSVITVVFASLANPGCPARRAAVMRQAFVATSAIGALMTLGAAFGGRALIALLLGDGYASGATLLWPYALATTLFTLANVAAVADAAAGERRGPRLMLVGAVIQTVSLVALVPLGLRWAVWLQVAAMVGVLVLMIRVPKPAPYPEHLGALMPDAVSSGR